MPLGRKRPRSEGRGRSWEEGNGLGAACRSGDITGIGRTLIPRDHRAGEVFAVPHRGQHNAPHMQGDQHRHQGGKRLVNIFQRSLNRLLRIMSPR